MADVSTLLFGLLGPVTVTDEAGEIAVNGAVRRRLLVRLLVAANRSVPVDRLQDDLWEGHPPPSAASTLKSHVSLLRRSLGPERLCHRDGSYILSVAPHELDVSLFEQEASTGRALLRQGDPRGAAQSLGRGLARWRGRALADVSETSWGRPEAVRLEELRADVLESWFEARIALGDASAVISDAEAAVAEHPLREALWARLMTALYLSGRQADSLRAYQRLREMLAEELGITPSPDLVALEGAVLRQELSLGQRKAWQPPGEAPSWERQSNLPEDLTSFVPRPVELANVTALLQSPGLLTLAGAGGIGKTRLALETARAVEPRFDGIWLCELAPLNEAADVERELASVIGCTDQVGTSLLSTITQRLSDGVQLVVLDNCEHLIDAAAGLAAHLLRSVPLIRVMATSRSPLGVAGEVIHRVPSMSLPPDGAALDDLMGYESVRLFVIRAKEQQPAFAFGSDNCGTIASVCVRLDGIPLALELAAARMRTLSVSDIGHHLDDRFRLLTSGARTAPARQQTLRSLIDWSYELLDTLERTALARLAVFPSDFGLAAAECVVTCSAVEKAAVVDLVSSLVDKSLLQADTSGETGRYRMLETVREYALEKLDDPEEQSARVAHALHFLDLVELAGPHLSGSDQLRWRASLERDEDNLRAAFATLNAEPGRSEEALRFGAAVSKFWNSRGYYGDEVDLLTAALERPDASRSTEARGAALAAAGYLMFRRGETARAQQYLDEAALIASTTESASLKADALRTMAWVADRRGDRDVAATLAEDAFESAAASGESHLIARAYDVRAATRQNGDPAGARSDYAEAVRYCRASGDGLGQASALNNLGVLELEQGDPQAARSHFKQALTIAEGVRDVALMPFLEYGLGLAASLDDDHLAAEQAFRGALQAARRTGQRSLVAYSLLGLAIVGASMDRDLQAAALFGAASALFEDLGEEPERIEADLGRQVLSRLRASLGGSLDGALSDGRRLSATEAADLAAGGL
ncbi:MAG: BTAD domain-containing putative transcriptional regulator [Acidimicrobiales bacterium]